MDNTVCCLLVAYDGREFLGWQENGRGQTIQSVLKNAIETILQSPVALNAASRTDSGVHADGQVVSFSLPIPIHEPNRFWMSLNQLLPETIAVLKLSFSKKFHATLDAKAKLYRYEIFNRTIPCPMKRFYSWHVYDSLDIGRMEEAALQLTGTHNFSSFANKSCDPKENPICHLESIEIAKRDTDKVRILVKGDRFLYRMVRNLVGTIVYCGSGKIDPCEVAKILEQRNRTYAGVTAPAHGLFLSQVIYSNDPF